MSLSLSLSLSLQTPDHRLIKPVISYKDRLRFEQPEILNLETSSSDCLHLHSLINSTASPLGLVLLFT